MPLQEIIKKLNQKATQLEVKSLIDKETDAKLDASTQHEFYQCFNLLVEQDYQDEAILLARKYNYVGLDEGGFESPLSIALGENRYKLLEAIIQSHLNQGGTIADYSAKKIPLLSRTFRKERMNEIENDDCYNFAKFLINHGAAESHIKLQTGDPASPYLTEDGASTIRMIQLLEEKGFKPTLSEMFTYNIDELNKYMDEDALIYLFKKYFMTGGLYNSEECPEATEILKNAIIEKQIKLTNFLLENGVDPNNMRNLSLESSLSPAIISLLAKHNYSRITGNDGKSALLEAWAGIQIGLNSTTFYRNPLYLHPLRFINALLQCGVNVAPSELNNLGLLNAAYLLEKGLYHLAYLAAPPLTPAEQNEFQILMKNEKPPAYFQDPEKLKEAAERKRTPDEIKLDERAKEYIQTRLDVVEGAGQFNPRLENARQIYKKISDTNFWMVCVDGEQIKDGPTSYDAKEYGSIRALQNAYNHMLAEFVDKPLTKEILKAMHKDITAKVANLGLETFNAGGEFQKKSNAHSRVGLLDTTMTPKGIEEIKSMEAQNSRFVLQKSKSGIYTIQIKNLEDKDKENGNIPALNQLVERILEKYHKKIEEITVKANERTHDAIILDEEKLKAIAVCIQELERIHPFGDANCRTFTLALNLMLLQNGFSPTLLTDPNKMDGFDVASFVREIKQGMIHFRHLAEHSRYPGEGTTQEIMLNAMQNGAYPYIKFKCDAAKMKEFGIPSDRMLGDVVTVPLLHWAVQFNYDDMIIVARKCGQDMNKPDSFKNTALMLAAFNGNIDMMTMLFIFPEIDVNLKGQYGLTAYDLARLQGHTEIAQLLVERGAIPNDDIFYADKKGLLGKFGYDALFVKEPTPIVNQEMKKTPIPASGMFVSMSQALQKKHATAEAKKLFPLQLKHSVASEPLISASPAIKKRAP